MYKCGIDKTVEVDRFTGNKADEEKCETKMINQREEEKYEWSRFTL